MITLTVILTSCSASDGKEHIAEMREKLLPAENISMDADITAEVGGDIFTFTVRYGGSASSGTVTVMEPDSVAGITALVSADDVTVSFCGAELCVGAVAENITPATAIPVLMNQWKYGYAGISSSERDGENRLFTLESNISDSVTQITWFTQDEYVPVRSEIYDGGYMVLSCTYYNYTTEG